MRAAICLGLCLPALGLGAGAVARPLRPASQETQTASAPAGESAAAAAVEQRLGCVMSVEPSVELGQPIRVRFLFRNLTDHPLHLLRWGNPFSPRHNGQFTVTLDGSEIPFERQAAPASPPQAPTARSYKTIPPGGASNATVSLTEGDGRYLFDRPGLYAIAWRGELLQVQEGAEPQPRRATPAEAAVLACNRVEVVVTGHVAAR